jgi:hypothetical protein
LIIIDELDDPAVIALGVRSLKLSNVRKDQTSNRWPKIYYAELLYASKGAYWVVGPGCFCSLFKSEVFGHLVCFDKSDGDCTYIQTTHALEETSQIFLWDTGYLPKYGRCEILHSHNISLNTLLLYALLLINFHKNETRRNFSHYKFVPNQYK